MARKQLKTYLCLFAQQHTEFRLPELLSLSSLTKSDVEFDETSYSKKVSLYIILDDCHCMELFCYRIHCFWCVFLLRRVHAV